MEKNTTVVPKILAILAAAASKTIRSKTDPKAAPLRIYNPPHREIIWFKYLITSVGSFSSVLYHPLAHLTAFGTPCCKLMTLGFLTPDPHLNRNQPRVQQRKHPTVGGFGHFLSPWQLYLQDGRERKTEEGTCRVHTVVQASFSQQHDSAHGPIRLNADLRCKK